MEKLFNNILVPVNYPEAGETVVKKAVELAGQLQCQVHVLDLVNKATISESIAFEQWKVLVSQHYQSALPPSLYLKVSRQAGPAGRSVLEYYRKHKIDLILLTRKKRGFLKGWSQPFPVDLDWLLKKVQCPVLTIHPGASLHFIKKIVLPVGDPLPMRKLLVATYIAKLAQATIHMVSTAAAHSGRPGSSAESLSGAFRLLKENTSLPVESHTLAGSNLADAAWSYARSISADLILVSPGKDSRLSRALPSRPLFIFNASRIPVLTIP